MHLTLEKVGVEFDGRSVLRDVSGVFASSSVTAVMGPSGSGKSTLLGVIAGEIKADTGRRTAVGDGRIEWVMQSSPLLTRRTAIDNVRLSSLLAGIPPIEATARSYRAMRRVGVAHLAREASYKLSGGERQRIAIARAMAVAAPMLLADEPTAALDVASRELVVDGLRAAAEAGATVILATHDAYVASQADHVFTLDDGAMRSEP